MRLGVLSDSHGRTDTTRLAVKALLDRGAELLLHLGDLGSEAVIDELVGHNARIVLGNCDWPSEPLIRYARSVGVIVDHPAGKLEAVEKRVVFTHGHLDEFVHAAIDEGVEYVLHGHTHEMRDERIERSRVINPGALCRARRYTAAILDLREDRLEFVFIPAAR